MLALVVAIIAAVIVLFALFGLVGKNQPGLEKGPFREAWRGIIEKAANESTFALAVINADKLLDSALKKRNFKGETMGERLVSAKNTLSRRQRVWEAHKLRNRLVHDEAVRLDRKKTLEALKGYESALKDLGAL
jgi:hypothetical protein